MSFQGAAGERPEFLAVLRAPYPHSPYSHSPYSHSPYSHSMVPGGLEVTS